MQTIGRHAGLRACRVCSLTNPFWLHIWTAAARLSRESVPRVKQTDSADSTYLGKKLWDGADMYAAAFALFGRFAFYICHTFGMFWFMTYVECRAF